MPTESRDLSPRPRPGPWRLHLASLWRSVTAELRVAVLVDMTDPADVIHLMPGGARSLTVVTGRSDLWELALYGAIFQEVQPAPSHR